MTQHSELELGVPSVPLRRRLAAELTGTAMLVAIVVGSGIYAQRLSDDLGLQLLENSIATGAGLVALILAFGSISGARFNPVVSLTAVLDGDLHWRDLLPEASAQALGGVLGAIVANLMFELPAVTFSTNDRITTAHLLAEVVATFGLIIIILGVVRSRRSEMVPFAVGGYIAAAYWFTSSTSFANPAVTIGRMFTESFAGIAPVAVVPFIIAQFIGGGLAIALDRYLHPKENRS